MRGAFITIVHHFYYSSIKARYAVDRQSPSSCRRQRKQTETMVERVVEKGGGMFGQFLHVSTVYLASEVCVEL